MQPSEPVTRSRVVGALIGVLSAAVALAIGHLVAALIDESASPVSAVGAAAIDLSPTGLKEWAISTFGEQDKIVLIVGMGAVIALFAAATGILAMRRRWIAYAALCVFGGIGMVAAMTRPAAGTLAPVPSIAAVVAGLVALRMLYATIDAHATAEEITPIGFDRRRFFLTGAAFGGVAAVAGVGSIFAGTAARRARDSRTGLTIPEPSDRAARIPDGADLRIEGADPFVTPNAEFYRVDTALVVPKIDAQDWRLRVHGMVDREIELDMEELLARPMIERDITLACVSNEVGGPYIGNARWIGAPLKDLLEEAGVDPRADQLVSRSADGWTAGTPTEVVMDGRDAILAVAMNGVALPLKHGFPVRMVVPGLYGFVSATKWLVDLELTTFDAFDAYWVPRGWARRAPIKTQSRIDTPGSGASLTGGKIPIAGVAWAQHTGVDAVEVRIGDGPWERAELAAEDTIDTWRQWVYMWDASPGTYFIAVRATDRSGYTQTSDEVPPAPDGATGWHTIDVTIT